MVPLNYYLVLSGVLFSIGTAGVFLRRNLITVLLSVEIMLNAHTEDDSLPAGLGPHALRFGALLSALLAVEVVWGLSRVGVTGFNSDPGAASAISSVAAIGQTLFTQYSFAFEVTSILILVSMVGAVIIAGSRTRGGR